MSQRFSYKPHVQNASLQRDLRITRHQNCPLLLGQVSVEGGKQRKEGKGGKKASRASTPATDAATSGGEGAEDRWDFECIECGQEGDPLLCCEVPTLTMHLVMGTIWGGTIILQPSGKGSSSAEHAWSLLTLVL